MLHISVYNAKKKHEFEQLLRILYFVQERPMWRPSNFFLKTVKNVLSIKCESYRAWKWWNMLNELFWAIFLHMQIYISCVTFFECPSYKGDSIRLSRGWKSISLHTLV